MSRHRRLLSALGAMTILCTAVCLPMAGCQAPEPQPGVTETETLPDLADDRTLTPTDTFRDRLDAAFADATPTDPSDLTWEATDGGVRITGYVGRSSVVVLPDRIDGQHVVSIADGAFTPNETGDETGDETDDETDAASETADAAEDADGQAVGQAVGQDVGLTALYIPDTVTFIGHGALKGCNELTTLRTPVAVAPGTVADANGQMQYSFGALFGADSYLGNAVAVPRTLTTLLLGEGLTTVPAYAFYACRYLVAVDFPSTLTTVEDFAFYDSEALAYADLSDTALTSLGECAFAECDSLLRLDLPSTVTSVGQGAVKGCAAIEDMALPFIGGTPDENTYLGYLFGARVPADFPDKCDPPAHRPRPARQRLLRLFLPALGGHTRRRQGCGASRFLRLRPADLGDPA